MDRLLEELPHCGVFLPQKVGIPHPPSRDRFTAEPGPVFEQRGPPWGTSRRAGIFMMRSGRVNSKSLSSRQGELFNSFASMSVERQLVEEHLFHGVRAAEPVPLQAADGRDGAGSVSERCSTAPGPDRCLRLHGSGPLAQRLDPAGSPAGSQTTNSGTTAATSSATKPYCSGFEPSATGGL